MRAGLVKTVTLNAIDELNRHVSICVITMEIRFNVIEMLTEYE
jgi:hypothetical protein